MVCCLVAHSLVLLALRTLLTTLDGKYYLSLILTKTHPLFPFPRLKTLVIANGFVIINGLLSVSSSFLKSLIPFVIARFLYGIMCSVLTSASIIYLSEIAPRKLRGAAGTLVFGILVSNVFGSSKIFGTRELWPCLYGATLLPAFLVFGLAWFCCESPKFVKNCPLETEQSIHLRVLRFIQQ